MFSCLFYKVLLFFNKFKPLAGQVKFFSCGFNLWVSGTFFTENPKNITNLIKEKAKKIKHKRSIFSIHFRSNNRNIFKRKSHKMLLNCLQNAIKSKTGKLMMKSGFSFEKV
jgi:hypothetical protein